MRKVYEYVNKVEAELVVVSKSGSTKYKFKFTGGVMDPKNKINAKHTTDNPIMQRVLETSPYFGKSVRLVAAFDTPATREPVLIKKAVVAPVETANTENAKGGNKGGNKGSNKGNGKGRGNRTEISDDQDVKTDPETSDQPEEPKVRIVEDVADAGAAASYLLSEGVVDDPTEISSLEGVLKVAKENNIFFPNLK